MGAFSVTTSNPQCAGWLRHHALGTESMLLATCLLARPCTHGCCDRVCMGNKEGKGEEPLTYFKAADKLFIKRQLEKPVTVIWWMQNSVLCSATVSVLCKSTQGLEQFSQKELTAWETSHVVSFCLRWCTHNILIQNNSYNVNCGFTDMLLLRDTSIK